MNLFQQTLRWLCFFQSQRQVLAETIKYHFLKDPLVPLRQPPVKNRFTCVHMYELRVAVADKQYTILHWALARLLMRDATFFFAESFMNRS